MAVNQNDFIRDEFSSEPKDRILPDTDLYVVRLSTRLNASFISHLFLAQL